MNKRCFLFTSNYPYGFSENFLEDEIGYLSKCFERVVIFSLSSKTQVQRIVPENVVVYSLNLTHFPFKKIRKFLSGFFCKKIPIDLGAKTLKAKLVCIYKRGTIELAIKRIIKTIKKDNVDLNNSLFYSYWLNETAAISTLLRNRLNLSNVICFSRGHGSDVYGYSQPIGFNPFQKHIIERIDKVFLVSEHARAYLSSIYPEYKDKFDVSRLGTRFPGPAFNSFDLNKTKIIVTCSNFASIKRTPLFAEAFVKLINEGYDVEWHGFGSGPDFAKVKKIINKNQINGFVTFYGRKANKDILNYYLSLPIYCFVNVSTTEGIPVSIMEAMSCGIPCLATNVGGTSELVDDSVGLLLDKNIDASELCESLAHFLSLDNSTYQAKKLNSFSRWDALFNAKKNYTKWVDILKGE